MSGRWPIVVVVVAVVVGAAAFYGGMLYGSNQDPTIEEAMATLQNAGPEEMAQAFRDSGGGPAFTFGGGPGAGDGGGQRRFNGPNGGIVGGEILSADAESITVQSQDGSTKIVFFSDTTSIARQAEGSAADLTAGINVLVTGSANADGSVTAENIQIRPAGAPSFVPGG